MQFNLIYIILLFVFYVISFNYYFNLHFKTNQMDHSFQKTKRPLIVTIENARHSISRAQNNLKQRPANLDIGNDTVNNFFVNYKTKHSIICYSKFLRHQYNGKKI